MSPDRLTVRQQLCESRDFLASRNSLNGDERHKLWVLLVAAIEDLKHLEQASIEVARLTNHLHSQMSAHAPTRWRGHPDWDYQIVEIGRKSSEDPTDKLEGEGWEPNGEGHDSWERFDYTEDHHFRRRKPE